MIIVHTNKIMELHSYYAHSGFCIEKMFIKILYIIWTPDGISTFMLRAQWILYRKSFYKDNLHNMDTWPNYHISLINGT